MNLNLKKMFGKKRIHLDYAATTPVNAGVLKVMRPYWSEQWANPSAVYKEGVIVRSAIEAAREKIAHTLRIRPSGIIFTSGGTEANNLAITGVIQAHIQKGKQFSDMEIITTRVEHPSIQECVSHLANLGVGVKYVFVENDGKINMKDFDAQLSEKTVLVSIGYVNSETGVIQDMKKITRVVKKWNEKIHASVLVHADACQAPLWLSCALDSLGVDLLSLDAGKCYGPKGVGILAMRHGVTISPVILGGKQERGLRAGTENTALIVGGVEAIVRAQETYKSRRERVSIVRDFGFALLNQEIPDAIVNGDRESRVANNINISIPGLDTEFAVIVLDKEGVAVSTRSACGSQEGSGSHVVREMTNDETRAHSTIRFTLGEETKKSDISFAISILEKHIKHMKTSLQKSHVKF